MNVFELWASINLETNGFEQSLNNAKKSFNSFSDSIKNISKSIKENPLTKGFEAVESVGKKAADGITAAVKGFAVASTAVAGFGTAAVKSGMEFDATMSQVSAISGATGNDFSALRNKALEMGASTKFSASEAAEALTYMGMAGWKTQDMLDGISGIMNLAAASGEDLASTSDIVTDALTAFGMSASESGHFADILAAASSNANTNVGMMGDTFKYVAPIAGAMGYSAEDAAVAIGLMANSGIKATQAGTALRSIITRMAKPTKESATAMEALGISITDSNGEMLSLGEIMVALRSGFSGLTENQKASYAAMLGGQEAMSGLLAIANASEEDFNKLTVAINNCNGAAENMAATMMDNLQGDLTLLGSAFESLQIAISDSLTPTLREFAQFGQKAMANLLEGFQGNGVTGFMSALSGIVTDGVTMLAGKAPEFASVTLQFVEALANGFLGARMEIGMAAINIFDALIDGFDSWISTNAGELIAAGNQIIAIIGSAFLEAGGIIRENIGQFVPLIARGFLDYHDLLFSVGMDILGAIGQGIVDSKEQIQTYMSTAIDEMVYAIQYNAPMIIEGGLALLEALVGSILDNASMVAETAVEIVSHLASGIGESAPNLIPAAVEAVLKFAEGLTNPQSLNSLIDGALGLIEGIVEGLIKSIPLLIEYAPEIVANLASGIISALPQMLEIGGQLLMGLLEGLGQAIVSIPAAIAKVVTAIVDGFKALFGIHSPSTVMAEIGINLVAGLLQGISNTWRSITDFLSSAWSGVTGIFSNALSVFSSIGGNIVSGIKNGISNAWSALTSWVTNKFKSLVNGVKSLLGIASPSKVFAGIGGNMALGVGVGWENEFADIQRMITNGLDFGTATVGLSANTSYTNGNGVNGSQTGFGGPAGNTTINIYNPEKRDAVTEAREWRKTTQRMALAYA